MPALSLSPTSSVLAALAGAGSVVRAVVSRSKLLAALEQVPDPRDRRGVRYRLSSLLALTLTTTVTGAKSFAAVAV
jgi:hypothetical protein